MEPQVPKEEAVKLASGKAKSTIIPKETEAENSVCI
jgi:hypothetical protein